MCDASNIFLHESLTTHTDAVQERVWRLSGRVIIEWPRA